MKKLFKTILNTIPRPLLIKLSYVSRPILTFFMRGNTYVDPIDGKGFKSFYLMDMKNKETMYYHHLHYL